MNSILELEEWKIDGVFLKKKDTKEGVIENTTLSGINYNIMDFIDYYYEIKVNFLTREEMKAINLEILSLAKDNLNMEFYLEELERWGFNSYSEETIISLNFSLSKVNFKPSQLINHFDLVIECFERVRV
ncbi:MAG: hypothetical protein ACRC6E_14780, partial [Fusobacteriaceae bacterium]